ncbi:LysM peptidoglycan-binding domain-containing protein [Demetria terragena]|uniref:LysM peptidoglycan-binding domain-containing protein n=1 Tax=Demetria terragena TaxID=63959 RepID=UPI00036591B8|nr:hypothetical protein [Demetria terragena]
MAQQIDLTQASLGHRCRAAALGALIVLGLGTVATLTTVALLTERRELAAQPRLAVDDAVPLVALIVLLTAVCWLAIVTVASCWGLIAPSPKTPFTEAPQVGSPFAVRIAALLLTATALTAMSSTHSTATAAPASISVQASDGHGAPVPDFAPATPDATATAPVCSVPEPGWTSSGPGLQARSSTDQVGLLGRCAPKRAGDEVVVLRGDSLWSIVERDLGPDASARVIAETWPRWYAANRDAIGPDPELILPGTTLHRPTQEVLR